MSNQRPAPIYAPYSENPEERLREPSGRPRDRAEGILVGFAQTLHARNDNVDIITCRHSVMEILDLAIAASENPKLLQQIRDQREDMNPLPMSI